MLHAGEYKGRTGTGGVDPCKVPAICDWFKTHRQGLYSVFDAKGVPTHDAEGVPLARSKITKLKNFSLLDILAKPVVIVEPIVPA